MDIILFFILGYFLPFYLLTAPKMKISKKYKKTQKKKIKKKKKKTPGDIIFKKMKKKS